MAHPTRSPWRCSAPPGTPPERQAPGEEVRAGSSQELQRPSAGDRNRAATPGPECKENSLLPALWPPFSWAGGSVGGQETKHPPANRPCGPARLPQPLSSVSDPLYRSCPQGGEALLTTGWSGKERRKVTQPCPPRAPLNQPSLKMTQPAAPPIGPPASLLPRRYLFSPSHPLKSVLAADPSKTVLSGRGLWAT